MPIQLALLTLFRQLAGPGSASTFQYPLVHYTASSTLYQNLCTLLEACEDHLYCPYHLTCVSAHG